MSFVFGSACDIKRCNPSLFKTGSNCIFLGQVVSLWRQCWVFSVTIDLMLKESNYVTTFISPGFSNKQDCIEQRKWLNSPCVGDRAYMQDSCNPHMILLFHQKQDI